VRRARVDDQALVRVEVELLERLVRVEAQQLQVAHAAVLQEQPHVVAARDAQRRARRGAQRRCTRLACRYVRTMRHRHTHARRPADLQLVLRLGQGARDKELERLHFDLEK